MPNRDSIRKWKLVLRFTKVPFTGAQLPCFFALPAVTKLIRVCWVGRRIWAESTPVGEGPRLVKNWWDPFRFSVVLPHRVTLAPHQVRILHEDSISLALVSANKVGLSLLPDEQDCRWAATLTPLVVFSWRSRCFVRLNLRLPATTGYPFECPLPAMPWTSSISMILYDGPAVWAWMRRWMQRKGSRWRAEMGWYVRGQCEFRHWYTIRTSYVSNSSSALPSGGARWHEISCDNNTASYRNPLTHMHVS